MSANSKSIMIIIGAVGVLSLPLGLLLVGGEPMA